MLGVVGTRTLPRRHWQAIARVTVSALVASLPLLYVSLLRPPPAALAGDTAFWFLMSNCVIAAIVATADDAGTLFFGPSKDEEACNDDGAVVPLAPDELTTERRGVQEEAAGSNPMELVASPFLIPAESGDAANVSALLRSERHETAIEQSNTAVMVKGHEGGEETAVRPTPDPDESIIPVAVGKIAITKVDRALTAEPEAEPEHWVVPKLLTSKSLPDQEVQEDAADDECLVALNSRPPDVLAHDKGGRLRRSVTDGTKSVAEEESEYWQLSDEELNKRVEDFIARFNRQMRLQIEHEAGV